MSSFGCCFLWLLIGAVLGWFLNYLLCKCCKRKTKETVSHYTPPPAPAAKAAPTPVASAPAVKAAAPAKKTPIKKVAPAKKATPVKKSAPVKKAVSAKAKPAAKKPAAKPKAVKKVAIDLIAAKAAGISIKSADDLTVIEGVGPKINELFKDNGLKTFAKVATATVPQMRAVLDKGGPRYRIANPSTWAKQAKLAANNKWKELKKLQDDLSGGVKK